MEANGLAAFILHHFGARAFAIYKFVVVIGIILICEVIAATSIAKARLVMIVGSVVYFMVVLYESWLIFQNISLPQAHHLEPAVILAASAGLLKGTM